MTLTEDIVELAKEGSPSGYPSQSDRTICPMCAVESEKSILRSECISVIRKGASDSYHDENGGLHLHMKAVRITEYKCSRGHNWIESTPEKCPKCDWVFNPGDDK